MSDQICTQELISGEVQNLVKNNLKDEKSVVYEFYKHLGILGNAIQNFPSFTYVPVCSHNNIKQAECQQHKY
jgi:hypothetical protein